MIRMEMRIGNIYIYMYNMDFVLYWKGNEFQKEQRPARSI